jgi:uncharacterized membrane protein
VLKLFVAYVAAALVFLAMDGGWLALVAPKLYRPIIGELLLRAVTPAPAVAFYLIYTAGLIYLAVRPAWQSGQWTTALVNGLVLGLVAYGAYDLTNHATLKVWSMKITLADMAWGAIASGAAASVAYFAGRMVGR